MRLFAATLATETNTFSPLPTGLASYRDTVFLPPGEHPEDAPCMYTAPLFVARRRANRDDFMAAFGPIAKRVIHVDSNTPLNRDTPQIEYVKGQPPDLAARREHAAGLILTTTATNKEGR